MIASTQNNQPGITFLELMIMLLLLGLFGSLVVPNLTRKQQSKTKQFLAQFKKLVQETVKQSLITKQVHQIFFDLDHQKIQVKKQAESTSETDLHKKFEPLSTDELDTAISYSSLFNLKHFYINGQDQMAAGTRTHDAWFYIMPDGTNQAVIMNLDYDSPDSEQPQKVGIVISPFYAQVQTYDTHQHP